MLLGTLLFAGSCCFRMDFTDNSLKVRNDSDIELGVIVNFNWPDTSMAMTAGADRIAPRGLGTAVVVNRTWDQVFKEVEKITVYYVP